VAPRTKHYRVLEAVQDQHQGCHKHDHVTCPGHVIPDDRMEASSERSQTRSTSGGEKIYPPTIDKEDE
jgi:hypothetical protein